MSSTERVTTDPEALRLARSLSRSLALHVGVRMIEALSIAWLAGALVAATAVVTMGSGVSAQAWVAAFLCAVCAGASAWIRHPPRRDEHLRDVDRRLFLGGALVTSAGIVPSARAGSLGAALVRRVADRAGSSDLMRVALPRTPLALLAALAGSAVLFAAQDARRDAPTTNADVGGQVTAALESAARAVRSAALEEKDGSSSQASGVALNALATELDRAARASERPTSQDGSSAKDVPDAGRLQHALEDARAVVASPRAAHALDMSRAAVETMKRAGGSPSNSAGPDDAGRFADAHGAMPLPSARGPSSSPADGSSPAALASAAANGRMSARDADPRAHSGPRPISSASGASERGVGATRWWPSSYDAIVEGWLAGDAPGR